MNIFIHIARTRQGIAASGYFPQAIHFKVYDFRMHVMPVGGPELNWRSALICRCRDRCDNDSDRLNAVETCFHRACFLFGVSKPRAEFSQFILERGGF